jgi:hypothetical protein
MSRHWKVVEWDSAASMAAGRDVYTTLGSYGSETAARAASERLRGYPGYHQYCRVVYRGPQERRASDPPTCHH